MKLARVAVAGQARMALVDEARARAALVGSAFQADPDPVRTVIRDGWDEPRLRALVSEEVELSATRPLAPFARLEMMRRPSR